MAIYGVQSEPHAGQRDMGTTCLTPSFDIRNDVAYVTVR